MSEIFVTEQETTGEAGMYNTYSTYTSDILKFYNILFLEAESASCLTSGNICCKEEFISTVSTTTTTTTTTKVISDKCEDYAKYDFKCAKKSKCLDEAYQ